MPVLGASAYPAAFNTDAVLLRPDLGGVGGEGWYDDTDAGNDTGYVASNPPPHQVGSLNTWYRNLGQIVALAGCDLLTISPELLAQLQAGESPVPRALDAQQAANANIHALSFNEASFRFALNEDAMATEKLAEGIRAFAADAAKLDKMIGGMK